MSETRGMFTKVPCLECEGKRCHIFTRHVHPCGCFTDEENAQFCAKNCTTEAFECSTCGGTGQIDHFTAVIYKARGGPAPRNPQIF